MRRIIIISILLSVFVVPASSRKLADEAECALLIIDIQNFYFPGDGPGLVNAEQASRNAGEILGLFREKGLLVVHVRHNAKKGSEIHKNVAPLEGEKVITKEEVNCFLKTDLLEYLKDNKITRLIITGMQTQMCVEAAVRAGHDFGFECIIISDACATRDLRFSDRIIKAEDVHNSTMAAITDGGYGKVIDLKTFKDNSMKFIMQRPE